MTRHMDFDQTKVGPVRDKLVVSHEGHTHRYGYGQSSLLDLDLPPKLI